MLGHLWVSVAQHRVDNPSKKNINWTMVREKSLSSAVAASPESTLKNAFNTNRLNRIKVVTGNNDGDSDVVERLGGRARRLAPEERSMLSDLSSRVGNSKTKPPEKRVPHATHIGYTSYEEVSFAANVSLLFGQSRKPDQEAYNSFVTAHGPAMRTFDFELKNMFRRLVNEPETDGTQTSASTRLLRSCLEKPIQSSFSLLASERFSRTKGLLPEEEAEILQKAHVDFRWEMATSRSCIGFLPLRAEGFFLQVWFSATPDEPEEATLIFVPYGTFLLLPAHCIHAGGFSYSLDPFPATGLFNQRLHFIVSKGLPGPLDVKNEYQFAGAQFEELKEPLK
jgi:hypothetical protein